MSDTVEKVASLAYQMGQMQLMIDQQKQTLDQQQQQLQTSDATIQELKQQLAAKSQSIDPGMKRGRDG